MFKKIYRYPLFLVRCLLTMISPVLNTKFNFFLKYKRKIDFKNPKDFNEKLSILKLKYIKEKNQLVIKCSDKYLVRDYVSEKVSQPILNGLLWSWDDPKDIDWDALPNQFVLKWNFGAGMNIICKDKKKLDKAKTIKQLMRWKNKKPWLGYSELQYKFAPKKIICEKYLSNIAENDVVDYKVYCFNGQPLAIFVMHDRSGVLKTEFFDKNWVLLGNSEHYSKPETITQKPKCFNEMMDICKSLSSPFDFVRCDFYIVDDKPIFGEMTFTPSGAIDASEISINGKTMGELLTIH